MIAKKTWMTGAGRPRVALHPGAERAQHLGDDEVGVGVYHAPDNDPVRPEGAGEGALSLLQRTAQNFVEILGAEHPYLGMSPTLQCVLGGPAVVPPSLTRWRPLNTAPPVFL